MFGFGKRYTQQLLESGDITGFVEGIYKDPRRFFTQAQEEPDKTLRDLAELLDMANNALGQKAILLGLTGAMKVAAKDKRAPKDAPALAARLTGSLQRAFRLAGDK